MIKVGNATVVNHWTGLWPGEICLEVEL